MIRALWLVGLLVGGTASAQDVEPEVEEDASTSEDLDALRAQLEALAAQVAAQQEALDAQQGVLSAQSDALDAQKKALIAGKIKALAKEDFKVDVEGYFRARGHLFSGLFDGQEGVGTYMTQRLRLNTQLNWKDIAKLNVGVQALDDVVWGDNADNASTPLFAERPSDTGIDGTETANIKVFRAWAELKIPVGILRIGRQSSHWGLGLLANHGDGFDDDFGENHYGNSFDRFLFATNPVAIANAIRGGGPAIPLTVAVAVDRLVEDPLTQYYGYRCEPGLVQGVDDDYDPRCDADGDGRTDLDHGYNDDREGNQRPADWWADPKDDVWEMVYVVSYKGEDLDWFGGSDDLTIGAYVIHRMQKETSSSVVVADLFVDAKIHGFIGQFEGVGIWGKTRGIVFPDSSLDDPLQKKASIAGYVGRFGYETRQWKLMAEAGYASGDSYVSDELFTGRSLHPDYNVGLVLYEEVISRVTQSFWGESGRGLWSKGGVYNSHYIFPRAYAMPLPNWEIIGGFLMAWPDRPDGAIIRCTEAELEKFDCALADATAGPLGWEIDLAVKHRWNDRLLFSLEGGFAKATDRLALQTAGLDPSGNFFSLQTRLAWEF